MDEFYDFLKEKRFLYASILRIFSGSSDVINEVSALTAEQILKVIDEIITRYDEIVKKGNDDVANLP